MDIISFFKQMPNDSVTAIWDDDNNLNLCMKSDNNKISKYRNGFLGEAVELVENNGKKYLQFIITPGLDEYGIAFNVSLTNDAERLNKLLCEIGSIRLCYMSNDGEDVKYREIMENDKMLLQIAMNKYKSEK